MNEFNIDDSEIHQSEYNVITIVRTTMEIKPTTIPEALIIPIRKALLETELAVSTKPVFESATAKHDEIKKQRYIQ